MVSLKDDKGFEVVVRKEKEYEDGWVNNSFEFLIEGRNIFGKKIFCNGDPLDWFIPGGVTKAVNSKEKVIIDFLEPDISIIVMPQEIYGNFFYGLKEEIKGDVFTVFFLIDALVLKQNPDGYEGEGMIFVLDEVSKEDLLEFAKEIEKEYSNG